MWNYGEIDKTPTVNQVKAIIDHISKHKYLKHRFDFMMKMERPKPNIVLLDLNDAGHGLTFKIVFDDDNQIEVFESTGNWIS